MSKKETKTEHEHGTFHSLLVVIGVFVVIGIVIWFFAALWFWVDSSISNYWTDSHQETITCNNGKTGFYPADGGSVTEDQIAQYCSDSNLLDLGKELTKMCQYGWSIGVSAGVPSLDCPTKPSPEYNQVIFSNNP